MTPQRKLLLRLIEEAPRPLDVRALLELGRREIPELDKATVYRTIALLKEHGLVDELDLLHHDGRAHYYEPVPDRQELHLVCLGCGQVTEITCPHSEDIKEVVKRRLGFQVTTGRVEMGGYCRKCRR